MNIEDRFELYWNSENDTFREAHRMRKDILKKVFLAGADAKEGTLRGILDQADRDSRVAHPESMGR